MLLRLGADAPDIEPLCQTAASRGMPLEVVSLHEPEVRRAFAGPLVLVRPDGHVAWRGYDLPANQHLMIDRLRGA